MTDSLQNLTTNYLVRQRSPEFDSVKEYANTLGEKLTQLEKVGRRLQKERQGMHSLIIILTEQFFRLVFQGPS